MSRGQTPTSPLLDRWSSPDIVDVAALRRASACGCRHSRYERTCALYNVRIPRGYRDHHPSQGRDSQGGLTGDNTDVEIESQAAVHRYTQDLDLVLEVQTLTSKTQLT